MQLAFTLLTLAGPLALVAAFAVSSRDPGLRPATTHLAAAVAGTVSLVAAISSLAGLLLAGPFTWAAGSGALQIFSLRLDVLSITMLLLVSFIGSVVLHYSRNYLDGDPQQGRFTGWLCLTLAAVMLLVLAGNLVLLVAAWICTSLFLHNLLLHFPQRAGAVRAGRKKFIVARLGDAALLFAVLLLGAGYGPIDIAGCWRSRPFSSRHSFRPMAGSPK
jgi:NAD(P)H-quinone oxidoreductase subunit 5